MTYDLITVGGGIGASSLARSMAEQGARVLVVERESQFRDRVRGEGLHPWGVAEAKALGLYDVLLEGGAREVRWWRSKVIGNGEERCRDLVATTPHGTGEIDFYHPGIQEVLLNAARDAGAEVRRGIPVVEVIPGERPAVAVAERGGDSETLEARLVVGADGRQSRVRRWAGFAVQQDPEMLVIAGALFRGLRLPADGVQVVRHPSIGQSVLIFPLGNYLHRVYFIHRKLGELRRLSGNRNVPHLIKACIETGADPDWFAEAEPAGPLAMFEGADHWIDYPYADGIALLGDAAGASDPSWGCGMALTLRDARVLRDCLSSNDDWDSAARAYARERSRYFASVNRMTRWLAGVLYEVGPDAEARRSRVWSRVAQEPERMPDTAGLGPDGPNDEANLRSLG